MKNVGINSFREFRKYNYKNSASFIINFSFLILHFTFKSNFSFLILHFTFKSNFSFLILHFTFKRGGVLLHLLFCRDIIKLMIELSIIQCYF